MASETVEDIVREMRYRVETNERAGIHPGNCRLYTEWADRIEAAHKREMENRALIAGVSLAEGYEAAHEREIADLKWQLKVAREFTTWCGLGINKVGAKVMNKAIECEFMMNHREIYNKEEGATK